MGDTPGVRIKFDGVAYALPLPLSPRERVRVREWTGLKGDKDFASALDAGDGSFLAALVIIAQQRLGIDVNPDAILDDAEFETKLSATDGDDATPPAEAPDDGATEEADEPKAA